MSPSTGQGEGARSNSPKRAQSRAELGQREGKLFMLQIAGSILFSAIFLQILYQLTTMVVLKRLSSSVGLLLPLRLKA